MVGYTSTEPKRIKDAEARYAVEHLSDAGNLALTSDRCAA
jgi:hypothetical protein